MLLDLGALLATGGVRRDDEGGVATRTELTVDRGDDHVDVGDAAVGGPGLLAVDHPFVLGFVVLGRGAHGGDVGAGVGLGGAERGDLDVVLGAEALRDPLAHLLGSALAEDRGHGERGAEDRHADTGVAPEDLLVDDRHRETAFVGEELSDALEAVEADLGGLLDYRPRELFLLVPFVGGRPHHVLGEAVGPLLDVFLVLAQLKRERGLVTRVACLLLDHFLWCLCRSHEPMLHGSMTRFAGCDERHPTARPTPLPDSSKATSAGRRCEAQAALAEPAPRISSSSLLSPGERRTR